MNEKKSIKKTIDIWKKKTELWKKCKMGKNLADEQNKKNKEK